MLKAEGKGGILTFSHYTNVNDFTLKQNVKY